MASLQSTINYLVNKVFSWEALFTQKKSCKLTYIKTELSEKTEKGKPALQEEEKIFKSSCCN